MASPATKGNRAQYWFMNFVIALGLCVYATIIGSSAYSDTGSADDTVIDCAVDDGD